jgi:hypothetical protein
MRLPTGVPGAGMVEFGYVPPLTGNIIRADSGSNRWSVAAGSRTAFCGDLGFQEQRYERATDLHCAGPVV